MDDIGVASMSKLKTLEQKYEELDAERKEGRLLFSDTEYRS